VCFAYYAWFMAMTHWLAQGRLNAPLACFLLLYAAVLVGRLFHRFAGDLR